jgi:glucosamine--fructose-6-phosphate aminotransferase (isomerizing)
MPVPTETAGSRMLDSILATPQLIAASLASSSTTLANLREAAESQGVKRALLLGCGASFCVCLTVQRAFIEVANLPCEVADPFEALHYPLLGVGRETLVVAFSHTGGTLVLRQAVRRVRELGALTLGVTDVPSSALLDETQFALIGGGGMDKALPKTRSYTTAVARGLIVAQALRGLASSQVDSGFARDLDTLNDQVPACQEIALSQARTEAEALAERWAAVSRILCVGSGSNLGTAKETSLLVTESTGLAANYFTLEEYAHGAELSLTRQSAVLIYHANNDLAKRTADVVYASLMTGAPVALVSTANPIDFQEHGVPVDIATSPGFSVIQMPAATELLSPLYLILVGQFLCMYLTLQQGRNPDIGRTDDPAIKQAILALFPPGAH